MDSKVTEINKKMPSTVYEENRFSYLPDHVIDSIFEWLPIQDVIRTSILSKKWRYKWTTMRIVVFDEEISKKLAKNGAFGKHGFIRTINQVLLLHKGSITKFYVYIPNMILDSFQEVDQWMLVLSKKGVKDFTLANSSRRYQLSFGVFGCHKLRKMELLNCIFKPPLQFDGFLNLESLILNYIDFSTNFGGNLINLPQLKKLKMSSCYNVYNLKIKATKLLSLIVLSCPDAMFIELLHSQSLICVGIIHLYLNKNLVRIKRMNLALMFANLPKVQLIYTDGHFIKDFIAEKPKWFPLMVNSLKHLTLCNISLNDLDHLHGVLCLLRNSPNLEALSIWQIVMESKLTQDEGETTLSYLESPDCLDQTLNRLRTVELSPLQGSRSQLLFVKIVLAHSPSLEKFTIKSNGTLNPNQKFNIAMDLMRFPRASSKAEMVYLNPTSCKNV